jgi:hypothetical protein
MADGGPILQGVAGSAANFTQTPTSLVNLATAPRGGTCLYLSSGASGNALYALGNGIGMPGVKSYGYGDDGVDGYARPTSAPGSVGL